MNTLLHDIQQARREAELQRRIDAAKQRAAKRIDLVHIAKRLMGVAR